MKKKDNLGSKLGSNFSFLSFFDFFGSKSKRDDFFKSVEIKSFISYFGRFLFYHHHCTFIKTDSRGVNKLDK